MNGFMGPESSSEGHPSYRGENSFILGYRQFLLQSAIPSPSSTYVFLDEHPDSINDGYFVNQADYYGWWCDLPASYHNGAAAFSFADGHAGLHKWRSTGTVQPPHPDAAVLPMYIPAGQRSDFDWVVERMSVDR